VTELWIQLGPPLPECLYIGIVLPGRQRATIPNKMLWRIMRYQGRVCSQSRHFICPRAAKLRAAIAALEIASMIEINFNITRNDIFISGSVTNPIKIHSSPGFA
jgi:hypothetical protein